MSETSTTADTTDADLEFSLRRGLTLAFVYNERQIILNLASFSSREQIWVDDEKVIDVKNLSFQSCHEIQVADETMTIAIKVNRMMTQIMVTARVGDRIIMDRDILDRAGPASGRLMLLWALVLAATGAIVGYSLASFFL
jgi:competence transcription factor ComK